MLKEKTISQVSNTSKAINSLYTEKEEVIDQKTIVYTQVEKTNSTAVVAIGFGTLAKEFLYSILMESKIDLKEVDSHKLLVFCRLQIANSTEEFDFVQAANLVNFLEEYADNVLVSLEQFELGKDGIEKDSYSTSMKEVVIDKKLIQGEEIVTNLNKDLWDQKTISVLNYNLALHVRDKVLKTMFKIPNCYII